MTRRSAMPAKKSRGSRRFHKTTLSKPLVRHSIASPPGEQNSVFEILPDGRDRAEPGGPELSKVEVKAKVGAGWAQPQAPVVAVIVFDEGRAQGRDASSVFPPPAPRFPLLASIST